MTQFLLHTFTRLARARALRVSPPRRRTFLQVERLDERLTPTECTPSSVTLGHVVVTTHCGPNGAYITVTPVQPDGCRELSDGRHGVDILCE